MDNPLSTNKAHPNATAIITHLQCMFHPPLMLHDSIPIFAQPNIAMPPMDSLHQHHLLEYHHQHCTTKTRGHKAFTHVSHTMTTTAAVDGSKNSKIPADANTEDRKLQKHMTPNTQNSTYHRTAHLQPYAAKLRTKELVQNIHRITAPTGNQAKLRHKSEQPQPHSKNPNRSTHHTTTHHTTDYRKLAQQAFYHKANL